MERTGKPMSRTNTDHIVSDATDGGAFKCNHCGARYQPPLPMRVEMFCEQGRGFLMMHRACPKPAPPDRQVKLPGADAVMGAAPPPPKHRMDVEAPTLADLKAEEVVDDRPPPSPYARFDELYPMPSTLEELLDYCSFGLTGEQFGKLRAAQPKWGPATGIFNAVANWGRIERGHYEAAYRARDGVDPIAGLTIPARVAMPVKLAEIIEGKPSEGKPPKKKRTRKG